MDKRTVIAVVLSVVIISVSFAVQAIFFPNALSPSSDNKQQQETQDEEPGRAEATQERRQPSAAQRSLYIRPLADEDGSLLERKIAFSSNTYDGAFSTRGANLISLKLNHFKENDGSKVEMIMSADSGVYPFNITLDDYNTADELFDYKASVMPNEWVFSKRFVSQKGGQDTPFVLTKKYILKDGGHMMEVRVALTVEQDLNSADEKSAVPVEQYTLSFGPQIGPRYDKLDGRTSYRHFIYYADGKRQDYTGKVKGIRKDVEDRTAWMGIEGKYFVVLGLSYVSDMSSVIGGFDSTKIPDLKDRHSMFYDRSVGQSKEIDDGYKFYLGPKKKDVLERYNEREQNEFEESGLHLEKAVPSDFWGWLSSILKWVLQLFYRLIPNWGVAIILLTIVIKILFFPLTHKSFESTHKMQALGPKIEELKQKHKGNSQKMNQEMAALYKREGVNPLGGCLPLLLQLPIFFALYGLFSNFFELRGAVFIPPWIVDLSSPERVLTLPIDIPFLGSELRMLPFIMLGTTFIQQKISQTPGQSSRQSKMLMYAMPAFFFFIMYNMPSGLLLYWTMQNLFTFITQYFINQKKKKKKAE